jgi:hypothetical protein
MNRNGWTVKFLALATLLMSVVASATVVAKPTPTALVRERVAAYVQQFVDGLTNVVAEERYVQQFRLAADRRRLRSDFLLVKYPGEDRRYQTFRDVLEVDGRPDFEKNTTFEELQLLERDPKGPDSNRIRQERGIEEPDIRKAGWPGRSER